jgi:hypothetical protein
MKTQSLGWLVGLGAVACSFTSCSQPATNCQVGLAGFAPFAAVYTVKGPPSPAGCEMMNPGVVQLGDLIGMEWYNPATPDMTTYDPTKATVAIKSDSIGQEYNFYSSACARAQCGPTCASDGDCAIPGSCDTMNGTCMGSSTKCMSDADCATKGWCANGSCTNAIPCVGNADCAGAACVNGTCAVMCGPMADGCGNLLDCGMPCAAGQTCGGGGTANVCGTGTCTPQSCADLGANCGPAGDGCGAMLMCGTCSGSDTCGGNGLPSVCGHITLDPDMTHQQYATGAFAQEFPDQNDMCQVVGLQPAQMNVTSTPQSVGAAGMPTPSPFPTDSVSYTWSNVNVYVTAAAQGSQFSGDLTYTENGCSADYHVVGMWPAVSCTDKVYNDPKIDPKQLVVIGQVANQDTCNPCAEPSKGRFVGSGISPDFPLTCQQIFPTKCTGTGANKNCVTADPYGRDPFYCVLAGSGDPPQLNPNPPTCLDTGGGSGGSGAGGSGGH